MEVCSLFEMLFMTRQVSDPYSSTNFTLKSKIRILFLMLTAVDLHTDLFSEWNKGLQKHTILSCSLQSPLADSTTASKFSFPSNTISSMPPSDQRPTRCLPFRFKYSNGLARNVIRRFPQRISNPTPYSPTYLLNDRFLVSLFPQFLIADSYWPFERRQLLIKIFHSLLGTFFLMRRSGF
ncbi:unnamed protein product [Trichobilharzia szidati]|nr:unnamed protein product [Trichobilharzia szidati]